MKYCLLLGFLLAALASWNYPLHDPAGTGLFKVAAEQLQTLSAGDADSRPATDMDEPFCGGVAEPQFPIIFCPPAATAGPRLPRFTTGFCPIRAPPPGNLI